MVDPTVFDKIQNWIIASAVAVLTLCLLVGLPLARKAGARAARAGRPLPAFSPDRQRWALLAALAPTVVVWLAVIGVSFIGLTGFAADVMNWRHWTNLLVPLSLDGISVSFGGWAFVAVKRGRHPGRAYRIVLAAATISATLNFVHGRTLWSLWAGIYLAFLSVAGMAMFHEMLDQFTATHHHHDQTMLLARYPRFGQRWLYAPITTFAARRAWIVYPPADGTPPTTGNALRHWQHIRRQTRDELLAVHAEQPADTTRPTRRRPAVTARPMSAIQARQ